MKDYESTEIAYKNGYAQGKKDAEEAIVRCKDCKYSKKFYRTGNRYCEFHGNFEYLVCDDDYCSFGAKMDLEG